MRKIYKYVLELEPYQEIEMPKCAKILSFQVQGDQLCVWAQIDTVDEGNHLWKFWIFGTGHDVPQEAGNVYVGTVQQGKYVWHLYTDRI